MKIVKILAAFVVAYLLFGSMAAFSADGDTVKVRTIEFQDRREGWYDFPSMNEEFQRILLHFTLRCPPGKQCGEWDYISNVFVSHYFAPSFRVNGGSPATYSFVKDTAWTFQRVQVDGQWVTQKTAKNSTVLYFYDINSETPTKAIDSMIVWNLYYDNYKWDETGKATDSTLVEPDSVVTLAKKRVYFNDNITIRERYELMRFITPYGNGLNLGAGFTWTLDVSDLKDMIAGRVHLSSPNGGWGDPFDQNDQEDLQLTFSFIEGIPPRNIINRHTYLQYISAVYDGNFESKVPAFDYTFSNEVKGAKLIVIQTGHGFGGNSDNCAEFCRKEAYVKVNNVQTHSQWIWRDCGIIPVFPQGGTWLVDRTNWCPGAEVVPHEYEITPYIKSGSTASIDYDMEFYNTPWNPGSNRAPVWVLSSYLITYGDYNFETDARLEGIIAPTNEQMHLRQNPITTNPIIQIKNTGKNPISTVKIKYGNNPDNLAEYTHEFGESELLKFGEVATLYLPYNNWLNPNSPNLFIAEIIEVNGNPDDYDANNIGKAFFTKNTNIYPGKFVVDLTTNNSEVLGINSPYNWAIYDANFNIVSERATTQNSTRYLDTVNLPEGNYRFIIRNPAGYGLGFWFYNSQLGLNNGALKFTRDGAAIRSFATDFGDFIIHEFTVANKPTVISSISGDNIDFASVGIGENKMIDLVLKPENNAGVSIIDLSLFFADTKKFEISEVIGKGTNFPYNLELGDSLIIRIKFTPQSVGPKTAQMRLSTNDQYKSSLTYNLSGSGTDGTSVEAIQTPSFSITPNPASEYIEISYPTTKSGLCLENSPSNKMWLGGVKILNTLGECVITTPSAGAATPQEGNLKINVSHLPTGIYFIKIGGCVDKFVKW